MIHKQNVVNINNNYQSLIKKVSEINNLNYLISDTKYIYQKNPHMKTPQTYQQFAKLTKQQQNTLVTNQKQASPFPFQKPITFPQVGFCTLTTKQQNKNIKLATYRFGATKIKGVVILFHTITCYTQLYSNTAKILANNGFTVVGFDQRGHGKSEGEKGYLDDINLMKVDAQLFIGAVFKAYQNMPIFLMGHGAGGALALTFQQQLKEFKFAGIILLSTGFKKPTHNKFLSVVSDVAFKLLPNKTELFQPQVQLITRNPQVCQFLKSDPKIFHGKICVGTIKQMMTIIQKIQQKDWKTVQTPPIVIIQGQFDKVSQSINAINFYEAIKTKDKQLWWFPNMWSCWMFQPEVDQINARLVKWLSSRV